MRMVKRRVVPGRDANVHDGIGHRERLVGFKIGVLLVERGHQVRLCGGLDFSGIASDRKSPEQSAQKRIPCLHWSILSALDAAMSKRG